MAKEYTIKITWLDYNTREETTVRPQKIYFDTYEEAKYRLERIVENNNKDNDFWQALADESQDEVPGWHIEFEFAEIIELIHNNHVVERVEIYD